MSKQETPLSTAEQLLHQGRFDEAEQVLRQILSVAPKRPHALYLLGCALFQRGRTDEAIQALEQAARDSGLAEHRSGLATVLFSLGRLGQTERNLREAIALDETGECPHYWSGLGAVLQRQGRIDEAIEAFQKAVELGDVSDDTRLTLGRLHASRGNDAAALTHLVAILEHTSDHAKSLSEARRILLKPGQESGQADRFLKRAIDAQGGITGRLCRLSADLQRASDAGGARQAAMAAIAASPGSADAWYCLGFVENEATDYLAAAECFGKVLEQRPNWVEARHNLARALFELGQVEEAYRHFRQCASGPREIAERAIAMMAVIAPGVPTADHAEVLRIRGAWASFHRDDNTRPEPPAQRPAAGSQKRRLRIGYLSSFFHRDNWMKPVWGLLNQHDREAFDIVLFSDAASRDLGNGYVPHERDVYVDIRSFDTLALRQAIRRSAIDVLVDLNGYSEINRAPLFAQVSRTAQDPLMVAWFNQYATSALAGIDYLIGDSSVISEIEERHYSEKILRVSGSYLTFTADPDAPPVSDLPWLREGSSGISFGCLCSQYKITREVIAAWSSILKGSPSGSTLLLKNKQLGSEKTAAWIRGLFAEHGIDGRRIRTEGPEPHHDFLGAYGRVDVALDVFPYNGGTTTTEALWQGVPVLTFHGDRWASRTSESLLRAAGLDEFVAPDLEGFIEQAIRLAQDLGARENLAEVRRGMRAKLLASPVCDSSRFAREMEELYRHCHRESLRVA